MKKQILFFLFFPAAIFAQEKTKTPFTWSVNYSRTGMTTVCNEQWQVRQSPNYSYDYGGSGSSSAYTAVSGDFLSAELEYSPCYYLSFGAGLQATFYNSQITKHNSNNEKYFYLHLPSTQTNTHYARVKSINEANYYLSVPLRAKIKPFTLWTNLTPFAALTANMGYAVYQKTEIAFLNDEMKSAESQILAARTNLPDKFFFSAYVSLGLDMCIVDAFHISVEGILPTLLPTRISSLTDFSNESGVRVSLSFPIFQ